MTDSCTAFSKCGGCSLLNVPYEKQLEEKLHRVSALLAPFCPVSAIHGMDEPRHYRNKVTATFSRGGKGQLIWGRFEEGTRKVVAAPDCLIENETAVEIIERFGKLAAGFRFTAFDPVSGTGLLRHVQVRTAAATGQVMLTVVTGSPAFPSRKNFVAELKKQCPELTTVLQSVNGRRTGMILGDRVETLYGPGFIEDEILGKRFRLSPRSFYQVNPIQTGKLYALALDCAALTKRQRVIDAYSGIGTIGLCAAASALSVIGCELNADAVHDAELNRRQNRIENARFVCADAGEFMVREAASGRKADVVFMDPPRAGADRKFLDALLLSAPSRIVYVSCGPETLARDLRVLTAGGYRALRAECVDMFPMTEHVETVVLMSRDKE